MNRRIFSKKAPFSTETPPLYGTLPLEEQEMSKMILITEDETHIHSIIKALLVDAGYTELLAADGMAAIEASRSNTPDLLLSVRMQRQLGAFADCYMT